MPRFVLDGVVQAELETFLARARARERPVPRFVERELRRFLRCGILAHGFVRVHCDDCGLDRVVAFSCKGRGFCPSCGGRRPADTAAHLADRVLPEVPVRQWVLSLPFALRYRLAYDAPLTSVVLGVFVRTVFASLRRRARKRTERMGNACGICTANLAGEVASDSPQTGKAPATPMRVSSAQSPRGRVFRLPVFRPLASRRGPRRVAEPRSLVPGVAAWTALVGAADDAAPPGSRGTAR